MFTKKQDCFIFSVKKSSSVGTVHLVKKLHNKKTDQLFLFLSFTIKPKLNFDYMPRSYGSQLQQCVTGLKSSPTI